MFFSKIPVSGVRLDVIALASVFIVTIGLFMLEYFSDSGKLNTRNYIKYLLIVMFLNILYPIIIDRSVLAASLESGFNFTEVTLSFLPIFWVFFAVGIVTRWPNRIIPRDPKNPTLPTA